VNDGFGGFPTIFILQGKSSLDHKFQPAIDRTFYLLFIFVFSFFSKKTFAIFGGFGGFKPLLAGFGP